MQLICYDFGTLTAFRGFPGGKLYWFDIGPCVWFSTTINCYAQNPKIKQHTENIVSQDSM